MPGHLGAKSRVPKRAGGTRMALASVVGGVALQRLGERVVRFLGGASWRLRGHVEQQVAHPPRSVNRVDSDCGITPGKTRRT